MQQINQFYYRGVKVKVYELATTNAGTLYHCEDDLNGVQQVPDYWSDREMSEQKACVAIDDTLNQQTIH